MKKNQDGKTLALELARYWESILCQKGLSLEVGYRIRKMMEGLLPLVDRLYLKTLKGQETIRECLEKTGALKGRLNSQEEDIYYLLTDLEQAYEDLLKRTYEFRVKAG